MNTDPDLPVLLAAPAPPPPVARPGEPKQVRDAYDALPDHSGKKRGSR